MMNIIQAWTQAKAKHQQANAEVRQDRVQIRVNQRKIHDLKNGVVHETVPTL